MTRFEDRLTELLRDASGGLDVSPALTSTVLARSRRSQRRTVVLGAGAGLLGTGVVAAGALALATPTHQRLVVAPAAGGGPTAYASPCPTVGAAATVTPKTPPSPTEGTEDPSAAGATEAAVSSPSPVGPAGSDEALDQNSKTLPGLGAKPADLAAIHLPEPVPGWPVTRFPSSTDPTTLGFTGLRWVNAMGVAKTPPRTCEDNGFSESFPTGPEVSILVAEGHVYHPAGGRIDGAAIVGTTTVKGFPAWITEPPGENQKDLYVMNDRYSILVAAANGTTVDEAVVLAESLVGAW